MRCAGRFGEDVITAVAVGNAIARLGCAGGGGGGQTFEPKSLHCPRTLLPVASLVAGPRIACRYSNIVNNTTLDDAMDFSWTIYYAFYLASS